MSEISATDSAVVAIRLEQLLNTSLEAFPLLAVHRDLLIAKLQAT